MLQSRKLQARSLSMERAVEHFIEEVHRTLDRMRFEYEMSYAEAIGALEIIKMDLLSEAVEDAENDE